MRRATLLGLLCLAAAAALAGATVAAFSAQTANGDNTVTAMKVFSGTRSVAAYDLRDASSGTAANRSSPFLAVGDAISMDSLQNFPTAFAATRYVDLDFEPALPEATAVTSPTLNLTFSSAGAGTACVYAEVRRQSTNAVLGTHGSAGSPLACTDGTWSTSTVTLSSLTTTSLVNDARIRLYARESTGGKIRVDRLTLSGTADAAFIRTPSDGRDVSGGSPIVLTWSQVTSGDGWTFASGNWTSAFSTSRYVQATFDLGVPTGATITGATLKHSYRSAVSGQNTCTYVQIRTSGGTLISSHGNAGTPLSCTTSSSTNTVDTLTLSDVNTAAEVNGLVARVIVRNASSGASVHDELRLSVTWSLS